MHAPAPETHATAERSTATTALREDPVVWLSSVQRDGRPRFRAVFDLRAPLPADR